MAASGLGNHRGSRNAARQELFLGGKVVSYEVMQPKAARRMHFVERLPHSIFVPSITG